jgi:hypothetical protein
MEPIAKKIFVVFERTKFSTAPQEIDSFIFVVEAPRLLSPYLPGPSQAG